MRRHLERILFASAAAATALVLAATQALAATWTVSNGGAVMGTSTNAKLSIATDTLGTITFTCPISTISGSLPNGTGLSGSIGSITGFTLGNAAQKCTEELGPATGTGQIKPGSIWIINAASYNSSTGTITGSISQVDFTFTFTSLAGTCDIEVKGSWNFTYTNGTDMLVVPSSSLTVVSATGGGACGGVDVGDSVGFTASYILTNSGGGHPVITSP